ncbi:sporulation protein [Neobacillus piezotolerans]|uniref:Sporulation protein n=1 Tax=Neobacillus piezotolerans TaxID=2259171 RepID=A0A3D8GP46_9BACI|nr:GerMN domain-containing protein [Neobacillus piezotolerans]RDU36274.1 sporulation protein [Neobacillus piezotolerans]
MSNNKKAVLASAVLVSSIALSGCGLFGAETVKKIDPPKSTAYTKDSGLASSTKDNAAPVTEETVKTELYLIDKNGYVVSQTLNLPKTTAVATQAVKYLVENGPVSEMLPNGFRAVLPADTDVSVNIAKDGIATVDLSKEFKNYQPEDEQKILQSLTWTLTQFDSVKKVKLKMNGHELTEMPVNGTPISDTLSRESGINIDSSGVSDLMNTRPVTVYYIGGEEGSYYYVPVTRRVSNTVGNSIEAAVMELAKGPSSTSLDSLFMSDVKLVEKPKVEDGKVTLNFNEAVYGAFDKKIISQQLLDALVLSLTEQEGIKEVAVQVNGKAELVREDGKKLAEPVTRPEKVNTGSF